MRKPVYQVSGETLLRFCEGSGFPERVRFFHETLKHTEWLHGVPRLLVLVEGREQIKYVRDGEVVQEWLEAPMAYFCTRTSWVRGDARIPGPPHKSLSFSYFWKYIRGMCIDSDGVREPPTERDVYYHTGEPLSAGGTALIAAMEALLQERRASEASALCRVLWDLTLDALRNSTSGPVTGGHRQWELINSYLREHREEAPTREDVAHAFSYSPGYVSALCRKYTGDSFQGLQLRYRLEHAEQLLLDTRMGLEEIAERSGFSCANYFIRQFKRKYGMTPHVYRNQTRE